MHRSDRVSLDIPAYRSPMAAIYFISGQNRGVLREISKQTYSVSEFTGGSYPRSAGNHTIEFESTESRNLMAPSQHPRETSQL
jgi:hypothetical protein